MRTRFSIVSTRRYSRSERKQPPAGGNTVNDGSAGLGYAIGVGTAAGVDPARFKAFEAGGFVDEFDEFARLFRAGHGRGDGGAAGVDGDAVAPVHGGELDRVGGVRVLTPPYHTTHRTDP